MLVQDKERRVVWNTLLHFEHPHGTATFAGCQLRYLIVSSHGILGALGVSASALHLRARDAWMAWSEEQRRAHLHRVVCLSRFLIRPGVRCRHLAPCSGPCCAAWGKISRPATAIARGWWRRLSSPPGRGLLQGGELRVRRAHGGAGPPGPPQGLCSDGEVGVHVRVGSALAPALGGAVCRCGAVARTGRGSGQRRVGGERVWRSPVGRQAVVGASGEERGAAGLVSRSCDDRQPDPRPGGGEGLLPVGRQARRIAGDAFEHSGAAPRAHYRADARPGDGSMHPGRDRPELRDPARLRWPGHHRAQPDVLKEPGSASASDPGGERRGPAPGGAALRFRRTARARR